MIITEESEIIGINMLPLSEKQLIQNHIALADSSLKDHKILSKSEDKITIGNPNNSSIYRCDLILSSRYLIMVGDLDTMVWAFCPYKSIECAISWISGEDIGYYIRQKASIGMGSIGVEEFNRECALYEIEDFLKEDPEDKDLLAIKEVISEGDDPTGRDVQEIVCDLGLDYNLGMVPSNRLLWAWSIVRKANQLLGDNNGM